MEAPLKPEAAQGADVLRGDVPGVAGEETDDSGAHRGRSIAAGRGGRNFAPKKLYRLGDFVYSVTRKGAGCGSFAWRRSR